MKTRYSAVILAIIMFATPSQLFSEPFKELIRGAKLTGAISGTTWEWKGIPPDASVSFRGDGFIIHPDWESRGLVTSWKAIDEHTILLTVTKGRDNDHYAILEFNDEITEYSGYDFQGTFKLRRSKKIEE